MSTHYTLLDMSDAENPFVIPLWFKTLASAKKYIKTEAVSNDIDQIAVVKLASYEESKKPKVTAAAKKKIAADKNLRAAAERRMKFYIPGKSAGPHHKNIAEAMKYIKEIAPVAAKKKIAPKKVSAKGKAKAPRGKGRPKKITK